MTPSSVTGMRSSMARMLSMCASMRLASALPTVIFRSFDASNCQEIDE